MVWLLHTNFAHLNGQQCQLICNISSQLQMIGVTWSVGYFETSADIFMVAALVSSFILHIHPHDFHGSSTACGKKKYRPLFQNWLISFWREADPIAVTFCFNFRLWEKWAQKSCPLTWLVGFLQVSHFVYMAPFSIVYLNVYLLRFRKFPASPRTITGRFKIGAIVIWSPFASLFFVENYGGFKKFELHCLNPFF